MAQTPRHRNRGPSAPPHSPRPTAAPAAGAAASADAIARLATLARTLGLGELDPAALPGFERYLARLLEWNQRINLTAVTDPDEVVRKHFADCLALVPHVPHGATLVDLGSGAGFPGAVVALARPDLEVTLVEPSHKRAAFLRVLVRELPLPRTVVRAETYEAAVAAVRGRFDAAVSRATWDLPDWLERGRALVRPGGLVLGMEGAATHALPASAERHPVALPDATRAVITLRV